MSAIRELQEMLRAEEKRSHDLAACLADMGRVNGRLRMERSDLHEALRGLMEWGAKGHNPHDLEPWRRAQRVLLSLHIAPAPPSPASQEPTP